MRTDLSKKGWSPEEIDHLKKHFFPQKESILVVFFGLVLLVLACVIVPLGYVFLSAFISNSLSVGSTGISALFNIILVVLGLLLGSFFGLFLVDFDRLSRRHHVILLVSVPIFISAVSLSIRDLLLSLNMHNNIIGAVLYAVSFTVPYAYLVREEWNLKLGRFTL